MTWLLLTLLGWLWHALVWGQALPFPGPGVKAYAGGGGGAAVTYVSDVDKAPATAASFTYTSFAVSGTNPVIVVLVAVNMEGTGGASVTSVAVSAGLTAGTPVQAITQSTAAAGLMSIWCIPAPSGTGTITVTLSVSHPYQSNALLLNNAHQTTPCPTGAENVEAATGSAGTLTVTLNNVLSTDATVGAGANFSVGDAPVFSPTQTFNNNTSALNMAAGYRLGVGAVSVTWGVADTNDILAAVRVVGN